MTTLDRGAYQELRLALVFNGGVSLAVWMGGVAKELDRFRTAIYRDDPASAPYRELLDVVRTEVRTDVIAGTSAGGINGALLGYVVARGTTMDAPGAAAGDDAIRDLWQSLGAIDKLLECDGAPDSALNHKALFRGCAQVFKTLSQRAPLPTTTSDRVRLTLTATDCAGYPIEVNGVEGRDHRLEMRFWAVTYPEGDEIRLSAALRSAIAAVVGEDRSGMWPFPPPSTSTRDLRNDHTAPGLLTRAARTTASFPVAFAPSTLPLATKLEPIEGDETGLTATPIMRDVLTARGGADVLGDTPNRYAVDGGLWDNAPFEAVLRSIDREPAAREVDRRVVYVIYTAAGPHVPGNPVAAAPPGLIPSVSHALTGPSNVSFANDLQRIARDTKRQASRRERLTWLIKDGKPDVFALARELLPTYAADVAPAVTVPEGLLGTDQPLEELAVETWQATPRVWAWGIRPVQVAVEVARRLSRELLRGLAVDAAEHPAEISALIDARETLSQLAWALSDLADRRGAGPLSPQERTVCGEAMAQFAAVMSGLHDGVLAALPSIADSDSDTNARETALSLAAGGQEMVIKRAIAAEIAMHALAADDRRHKVDYSFHTIRPRTGWPLPPGVADPDPRPPLAGVADKHFGGFMLTSWRLNDWMWGRLDASTQLVDMLLDKTQIQRLTAGRSGPLHALATQLAAVAIPADGVDPPRARYLAYTAFASHPELKHDPEAPSDPRKETGTQPSADELERWRRRLADVYTRILASSSTAPTTPSDLDTLRADVRRRIQYAILDDERPGLVQQIAGDWANPELHLADSRPAPDLDEAVLRTELDGGLYRLTCAAAKSLPLLVLAGYAERAVANTFGAIDQPRLADLARAAEKATDATEALEHGISMLKHYVLFRHP